MPTLHHSHALLRSDVLSTAPHRLEAAVSRLSKWKARKMLLNALVLLAIPIWRDVHFYSAHRFIHIRAIYRLVHSLHHRNTDPEPFSGMTMHPVEHLLYFTRSFVCLFVGAC